ncbi:bestrophin-like domain [Salinimonas iocasae]|nr:hypothetical protein [Salinimonas iocasae]
MNTFQQLTDSLSIFAIFTVIALIALVVFELGYRHGRWWQERTPEEKEGPTGMIVGSLLSLMAFLLAITMGMASERFNKRHALVLEEANSIGTTYLRAGFLPEKEALLSRNYIEEYVLLRTGSGEANEVNSRITQSVVLHERLWSTAEQLARRHYDSPILALYIDALNDTIDLHETRVAAGIYSRVPATIVILLLLGSMLTMGMVGYNAGLTRRRSPVTAIVLIGVLAAVITLIIDLDRPQGGFLTVSQQPLIDLQQQIAQSASSSKK